MNDPYEQGRPKYATAQDIYDALCELAEAEEMQILKDIGLDVSDDKQGYYYFDKGNALKEKFEEMSGFGDKMWLMDLAITQKSSADGHYEAHDLVFEALRNDDLAKRIGFKKLFVDDMMNGYAPDYKKIVEEYGDALSELSRFDSHLMATVFVSVMQDNGRDIVVNPYLTFAGHLIDRVSRLELTEERALIVECRAHLSAYDDFLYSLRINQALYDSLNLGKFKQDLIAEFDRRTAEFDRRTAEFDRRTALFMEAARRAGLLAEFEAELQIMGLGENLMIGTSG